MKKNSLKLMVMVLAPLTLTGPAVGQFGPLTDLVKKTEKGKKIAHFRIDGPLTETPVKIPPLFGDKPPQSLKSLLERFKEARQDNSVVAVVIDIQHAQLGLGQLEEIHKSLGKFAAVDKDVFVHADMLFTGTYAAATGASHISVVPTGDVWLLGFYGETPYLRGAFDKLGIFPDFEHCGDYKSAHEIFTQTGPSKESKEMTGWLFDSLYEGLVEVIAEGRGVAPEKVRSWIDDGPYSAEDALAAGLIDAVQHRQDFISDIKKRYGRSVKFVSDYGKSDDMGMPDDMFAMFSFIMEMLNPRPKTYTEPSVAIVYVEGMILTGSQEVSPFGVASGAYSTTIRKALDEAAEDRSVKAVVLRIDSPGGSALASEIILNATERVAGKKPLIVSMGNVAGSGGYYVTCASETIFADRNTITASIGVVGGKLVTTEGWNKLGINWYSEKRGEMAALMSSAAPFNEKERAKIKHYMTTVYEVFKQHVAEARGDRLTKPLVEMAGGRVYTGEQALALGLVDKIGGLEDAIKFAANRAGFSEYDVRVIPEPPNILELLFSSGAADDEYSRVSSPKRLSLADTTLFRTMLPALGRIDPLRARAILHQLKCLELIHEEGAVMMMPTEWVIR